jgi:hypothetical protein
VLLNMLLDIKSKIPVGSRAIFGSDNVCFWELSGGIIVNTNHSYISNGWVREKVSLEFRWGNLERL